MIIVTVKKILLAVYVEAHRPASQRRMTLHESLHRPQLSHPFEQSCQRENIYIPVLEHHFSSTLVEGHRNTLFGKHCREIRQTDKRKVRACASHTTHWQNYSVDLKLNY